MEHKIHRIIKCNLLEPYRLELKFEDGLMREIDFSQVLEGELYEPLKDDELFAKVQIDPEVKTIIWPNGADFDPAILHDWPLYEKSFIQAAKRWKESKTHAIA